MPGRALATAFDHLYPFTESHCVAPSSLSKCQPMERSTSATRLPGAGEGHRLQAMHLEAADQGPLFPPFKDGEAWAISPPLTAGSEVAPASPITTPPYSGEPLSLRPSCYEFSRGNEDLEIMFELNSDMGITLRHPTSDALAQPPPPPPSAGRRWLKRRAEEPLELVDSSTSVPSGGYYDWAPTGLDMGQAPMFWQRGAGYGGDPVQSLELLGARLHQDARRQLELTKSRVWFGPGDSAV